MSVTGRSGRIDRKKRVRKETTAAVDRRALRTRGALLDALLALIAKKGYDATSVSDIVDEANVGRSTFYTHFTSKEDLLRNGVGGLRAMMVDARKSAGAEAGSPEARLLGFSHFMFEHTREQLHLYRALMGSRASAIHLDKVRHLLAESVREDLAPPHGVQLPESIPREVAVQYLVGAFTGVLTWWLDRGAKEPPEQIDAAFRSLAMHGLGRAQSDRATASRA